MAALEAGLVSASTKQQPNFLFIMTDDQDLKLDSLSYPPLTMKHMRDKGTMFVNHFVTTALCCPWRVSLWTGRQAHNTNVTDVHPPWGKYPVRHTSHGTMLIDTGGYPKFVDRGFNNDFLPVWLQQAGYDTYYTGKLMNAHSVDNYDSPHVSTYDYMNATYQRNHDPPVSYLGRHTTEVLREKAMGFLENALDGEWPFFLAVAPIAPHSNMNGTYGGGAGLCGWMSLSPRSSTDICSRMRRSLGLPILIMRR
jgi:arylsulfatase A-like enzyme